MWIQQAGVVNDRMVFLGTRENNIYLLRGEVDMLVGGGGQWIVPDLIAQIRSWQIDMQRVKYLFVGHSHFDHCGAVPYLQKRYPHLQVLASRQAVHYFGMEKAIQNARKFGREVLLRMNIPNQIEGISLDFDPIEVSRILHDGDTIDIGNEMVFKVFETPGHSRCSMTLYAEAQKWLFPSDALSLPIHNGLQFACTATESFSQYISSLKRLEMLSIELCAWEHFGFMAGSHVEQIVKLVLDSTNAYKEILKNHHKQTRDEEATAKWAANEWLSWTGFKFIPLNVMTHICRQMVHNAIHEV